MSDQKHSLEERLKPHPHLKQRIEKLLEIIEEASGDLDKADEAEQRVKVKRIFFHNGFFLLNLSNLIKA